MQRNTPPQVPSVVKREDKIDTLCTFLRSFWLMPRAAGMPAEITIVARSADSPVARAMVASGAEIVARNIAVRAIFAHLEPEKTSAGWSIAGPEIPFRRELRWARNPRLADAHEQLVLDGETCWIGDCMRRDPSRRDAYEQFANGDVRTSATMALSFNRLWMTCEPLVIRSLSGGLAVAVNDAALDPALAVIPSCDESGGPMASSPH